MRQYISSVEDDDPPRVFTSRDDMFKSSCLCPKIIFYVQILHKYTLASRCGIGGLLIGVLFTKTALSRNHTRTPISCVMHVVQFIINLVAIHYINAESRFWGVTRTMYVGMNSIALTKSRGGGGHNVVNTNDNSMDEESKPLVILIDVDNTLYSEKDLVASTRNGEGIESQMIRNTHIFGMLHFNLTSNQCNELYRKYGTTIEGLRQNLPPIQVEETMPKFYDEVYNAIDYSCLLGGKTIFNTNDVRSGYDHGTALQQKRTELAEFLKSLSQTYPVYLASNSPYVHVRQVINCMGLAGVEFAGIVTPDMNRNNENDHEEDLIYPTKSSPQHYYKSILKRHPLSSNRIILLDDSLHNLNLAKSVGIEGIHINHSSRTLDEGLSQAVGHILPPEMVDTPVSMGERFTFSDVEYLHSKNEIDINAINPIVWDQLAHQLALRLQRSAEGVLHVADLGAGMLSMLELLLIGGGAKEREKLSMLFMVKKYLKIDQPFRKIEYSAYESNLNLLEGCKDRLSRMGFHEFKADANDDALTYKLEESELTHDIEVTIHLHLVDYQEEQIESKDFDLVIGCCFADLFDPGQLAISLQRFANGKESPPLVYLPITFAGITQFHPEYPAAPSLGKLNRLIPSDTSAFRMYSDSLTNHGHNLDPTRIVSAISDYGGSLISKGSSDWIIDPTSNRKLWGTMMYFFGMSGAREIANHHLDAASWIRRCRQQPRTIQVSNVDLLLHLQDASREHRSDSASDIISPGHSHEIQFVAPYNVTTIIKTTSRLSPDQVEIESICSLISSGTELKIYRGTFDLSSSLDVNIKGKRFVIDKCPKRVVLSAI